MATRQYIGARYTPGFKGTYSATTVYEALDVVDDGAGTSYIAKNPVPAGTPLTDTDYWMIYGSSNGAIIALQNRMTAAEGDIINIQLDVSQLQGSVIGIGNDITRIDGDITRIDNELAQITSGARRMVVISDSYGLVRGGNTPWTDYLQTITGLSSSDYFDFSEGSMGFNRTGDGGHTAQTLLAAHSSDVTDHDTITDVIFGLGINDINGVAGLDSAMGACITYTKTEYPNARIWIGYISNQTSKATAVYNNYLASLNIYKETAVKYGCRYITDVEYVMHNWEFFQSDGIHPTSSGCYEIAGYINSFMLGGASYSAAKVCTFTSSYLNTTYATIREVIAGPIAHVFLTLYGFSNAATIGAGASLKIATINDPLFGGTGADSPGGDLFITISGALVPFKWFMYDGDLYIQNLNSSTSYTIAASTSIRYTDGNFATIIC